MEIETRARGKAPGTTGREHVPVGREVIGAWGWSLQRVTAVFLFFILGTHLWVLHITASKGPVTFAAVAERLRSPLFQFLDLALLALGLYHSLNGIRSAVLDFGIGRRAQKELLWALVAVGVVGFGLGVYALGPFITGK